MSLTTLIGLALLVLVGGFTSLFLYRAGRAKGRKENEEEYANKLINAEAELAKKLYDRPDSDLDHFPIVGVRLVSKKSKSRRENITP